MEEEVLPSTLSTDNINKIVSFIDDNFKIGTQKEELNNYRLLIKFLNESDIEDNISILDAGILISKCPQLTTMLESISKFEFFQDLLSNENLDSLYNAYTSIRSLEVQDCLKDYYVTQGTRENKKDLDLVKLYISELIYPVLSREEELILAHRMKNGDEEAKDKLIKHNLRLVFSIAKRYDGYGPKLMDLVQEGNIGLIKAAEKFDYTKGYKFSTYATWWIKQSIYRFLGESSRVIRLPIYINDLINKMNRFRNLYIINNEGREPSNKEIADFLGVKEDLVKDMLLVDNIKSLNEYIDNDDKEETELMDVIEAPNSNVSEIVEEKMVNEDVLDIALKSDKLSQKYKNVLFLRLGIMEIIDYDDFLKKRRKELPFMNECRPLSLEEVGIIYNVTRERIRQIEVKALRKLSKDTNLKKYEPNSIEKELEENYIFLIRSNKSLTKALK